MSTMVFDREEKSTDTTILLSTTDYIYRGEGNANLVVAIPSQGKVIRFRKSSLAKELSGCENYEENHIRSEVDFIEGVIFDYLGCYVCVPEILSCQQTEIARLSKRICSDRPERRKNKDIVGKFATIYPDYTYLERGLRNLSQYPTFCIEIKPKQGFINRASQKFSKCPYCLLQFLKLKTGSITRRSSYCPFDLFSGNENRMRQAIQALLQSPQNNLKIFKNGLVVYDAASREGDLNIVLSEWFPENMDFEDRLEQLLFVIKSAILRPFDYPRCHLKKNFQVSDGFCFRKTSNLELEKKAISLLDLLKEKCDFSSENLPEGSVLERLIEMQKMHQSSNDFVYMMSAEISDFLTDNIVHMGLEDGLSYANKKCEALSLRELKESLIEDYPESSIKFTDLSLNQASNLSISSRSRAKEEPGKELTINDCLQILRNYLLFCTARDCSVMMTFQKVDKNFIPNIHLNNIISLSDDLNFMTEVHVLDLNIKSIKSIKKHEKRDINTISAIIEVLEKSF